MLSVCLQPPPWTCWKSEGTLAEPAVAIVSVYFSWGKGLLFCRRGINEGNIWSLCLHRICSVCTGLLQGTGCRGDGGVCTMQRALTARAIGMGFSDCRATPVPSLGTCEEDLGLSFVPAGHPQALPFPRRSEESKRVPPASPAQLSPAEPLLWSLTIFRSCKCY